MKSYHSNLAARKDNMNSFHIFVDAPEAEEKRGKASTIDELFSLLNNDEKKKIFAAGAFSALQRLFHDEQVKKSEDSYMADVSGISINFISNGNEITTLVFYF